MAIKINFAPNNLPEMPTFILTTRSGRNVGSIIPNNVDFHEEFGQYSVFSCYVYKDLCDIWDEINDFKLIYYKEADEFYEISVELDDGASVVKTITASSLGYAELSQIKLYDIEINTEEDIARDDYSVTVLYDEDNASASLLNRITEKCPHYYIAHVDSTIANIQRTFTFNNTTIMDAFNTIAEEIDCVFIISCKKSSGGGIDRSISVYDLESYCNECGERTSEVDVCEHCGSKNLVYGYGEDTTILINKDNLTDNIVLTTDSGSIKNCFRISGGDDYMTATVKNCNPNGSNYIWYINDSMRLEMSKDLQKALSSYDELYEKYTEDTVYEIDSDLVSAYNEIINKYIQYNDTLVELSDSIAGYSNLMNVMYDAIDLALFLQSEFMPSISTQDTDASTELAKLSAENLSPVAVNSIKSASESTVNSTIESIIKIMVDSRYKAEIVSSVYTQDTSKTFGTWVGTFKVTNYSDDEDVATSGNITLTINGDTETFLRQRIDRAINQENKNSGDIVDLFSEELDDFKNSLELYCLERLRSIYDSCRACIDILVEQGVADNVTYPELYTDIYIPYYTRLQYIEDEIQLREYEIAIVDGKYDLEGNLSTDGVITTLEKIRDDIADVLDFEQYLGDDLWLEFAAYRREDDYTNNNYISDGLSNADVFAMARELINNAKKDLKRSATKQHQISSTLYNLLAIKEFTPLIKYFSTGNWLRIRIDNELYKLRLLSYDIDFTDLTNINVVFSDVSKISNDKYSYNGLQRSLSSMASSYDTVMRQASKGSKSDDTIKSWQEEGISLSTQKIMNDSQFQDVVFDDHGILLRKYIPETGEYDAAQAKIINQGLYITTDNWKTARAGIGYFTYYDPFAEANVEAYGVIADTIVGDLILSRKVRIFNESGSVRMDNDGFVATDTNGNVSVRIRPGDSSGIFVITGTNGDLLTVDSSGNLTISGYLTASAFNEGSGVTIDTDGFRLYGEVPVYQSASSSEVGSYFGYSSDLYGYTGTSGDSGMIIRNTDGTCGLAATDTGLYLLGGSNGIHLIGTVYIGNQTLADYINSLN